MRKGRIRKPAFTKYRIFKLLSTIKFAIFALLLFAGAMIYGTLCESRYGATYAARTVYQTVWFYAIQGSIALSLFLAMMDRIPAKKKQIGFFIIHISLLTLMGGAVVTRTSGVDGSIELGKEEYQAAVKIGEDRLVLTDGKQEYTPKMPVTPSPVFLQGSFHFMDGSQADLIQFIPYAKADIQMRTQQGAWSSQWLLTNDQFQLPLNLSLGAEGVSSRTSEGPLTLEVLPENLFNGLTQSLLKISSRTKYLLFFSPEGTPKHIETLAKPLQIKEGVFRFKIERAFNPKANLSFFRIRTQAPTQEVFHFIPKYSAEPFSRHLETLSSSPYRLYELGEMRKRPTVLMTKTRQGIIQVAYGKGNSWARGEFKEKSILLPWMRFKLILMQDFGETVPVLTYAVGVPHKEDEKNIKAVQLQIKNSGTTEMLWITDRSTVRSRISNIEGMIGPEEFYLPFQLKLDRFKMDMIPGTDKPASYESFVQIKDSTDVAHVYMNNPLKKEGYTLYQASYFKDDLGEYRSILSVNKDPGRPIKYFGSALLVLGLIFHFLVIYGYIKFKTTAT